MNRRSFLSTTMLGGIAGITGSLIGEKHASAEIVNHENLDDYTIQNGRINQSVCGWCYQGVSTEELAAHAAKLGMAGIDLVGPDEFQILKKYDLVGTMTPSHGITKGLNRVAHHEELLSQIRDSIDATSEAGWKNVICFSGNRDGMDDEEGLENCAIALKQIVGYAEKKNIVINMELLNSKVNHPDYMCDRTHWGVALAKNVGSPNFKLLYDIYHMQVQEGDVIATIRDNIEYIGHFHTAGVPGRHELDDTQELYYPAIMRAIVDTGFDGYVGQEFIPTQEPKLRQLTHGVKVCDV